MEEIIPWEKRVGIIAPYYPQGKRGRPPMGIEKMLRMYLLQIWFALSDAATKDAIYDSYAMRKFTGINFLTESVPDEATLCKFRRLLEKHEQNKLFFEAINRVMEETGHMLKGGTIVDATIINAPSSTKNAQKARDPEMHQTKKGNEWRFGMRYHVGVDAFSGLVHTITVTAANVHDITQAAHLIRKDDEFIYGDSAYLRIQRRSEVAGDPHLSSIDTGSTAVPVPSLAYPTGRLTGKDVSSISSPPYAARRSMFSESSNVSLGIEKLCTADSGRMRTVCMPCLPVLICICLPEPGENFPTPGEGLLRPLPDLYSIYPVYILL